nr:MAG TPA_asm: hypothetical protein [Bacteriophage sp.]
MPLHTAKVRLCRHAELTKWHLQGEFTEIFSAY